MLWTGINEIKLYEVSPLCSLVLTFRVTGPIVIMKIFFIILGEILLSVLVNLVFTGQNTLEYQSFCRDFIILSVSVIYKSPLSQFST